MKHLLSVLFIAVLVRVDAQVVQAELLGQWSRNDLVGSSFYNNTYNDVWGVAVGGREYAAIGSTAGTHFIDVTNPTQPVEVAFVPGAAQGGQIVHRDFKNYGCYLYGVCDEGSSTLQIMDVSYLPDSVRLVYNSNQLLARTHNIFIDTINANLYCFASSGGAPQFSAMRVYSLANPELPQYIGEYDNFGGLQVGHVHDGYVRDGIAYLNCGGDGLAIVDFSNPAQPQTLGTLTNYPFSGYNHSSWGSYDGNYLFMADENHGYKLKSLRVDDPSNIQVAATFNAGSNSNFSIPHNQLVACNYLYVSYYYDGLQVYDVSNPENPVRVMHYPTSNRPYTNSYEGAWGVYPFLPSGNILVSDMQNGLFVVAGPSGECDARDVTVLGCSNTTGVEEQAYSKDWSLYPQPAGESFTFEVDWLKSQQSVKLELLDMTGRIIQRFDLGNMQSGPNTTTLDLSSSLSSGVYMLQLKSDTGRSAKKLLVNRTR